MAIKKCSTMRMKAIIARLNSRLKGEAKGEMMRFAAVGSVAVLLQYALYWTLVHALNPTLSMTIAYLLSFLFNFFASSKYTFKVRVTARHGAGFALAHAVNYLLQVGTLNLFIALGIGKQLAPLPMFAVCVPVNFVLVRYFLKR